MVTILSDFFWSVTATITVERKDLPIVHLIVVDEDLFWVPSPNNAVKTYVLTINTFGDGLATEKGWSVVLQ